MLAEIGMTDDLGGAGKRGAGRRVVEAPDQPTGARQLCVGQDVQRVTDLRRPCVHLSLDVGEDLPSLVVDAEQPRRPVEPNGLEVAEERVDELRVAVQRTTHGVADTHDARRLPAAHELHLFLGEPRTLME